MDRGILSGQRGREGVRPFNPYRDTRPVLDLLTLAFGDSLGSEETEMLTRMRRLARWNVLLWLFLGYGDARVPPGFIWVEGGKVVGNVSLRRAITGRGGFFIGNVAVHPNRRGRGIARALMEAAIEEVISLNGQWVGLEVEEENRVARVLYEGLGFQEQGVTLQMFRPAGPPLPPPAESLSRGRSSDGPALVRLMQATVSEPQRTLLELCRDEYRPGFERTLDLLLSGQWEYWWVIRGEGAGLKGAVRLLRRRRRPDRLEVLVAPGQRGQGLEERLVRQGVAFRPAVAQRKAMSIKVPGPSEPLVKALRSAGFQEQQRLVQMRLDLRS